MKQEYWVIETGTGGNLENSESAIGPFGRISDAEKYLRDSATEAYLNADSSLRELEEEVNWADPVHIVQVVKTVKQIPNAKVTVKLMEI